MVNYFLLIYNLITRVQLNQNKYLESYNCHTPILGLLKPKRSGSRHHRAEHASFLYRTFSLVHHSSSGVSPPTM